MEKDYPRWSDFQVKAKKSVNEQFEDLCRLLFCKELGIERGSLVQVKNQPGNETELFVNEGRKVGFQCKYFDFDSNFDNEKFKNSITVAKKHYPDQFTIYLYSNKNPKSVKSLKELESFASKNGMTLVYRFNQQITDRVIDDYIINAFFFKINSEVERLINNKSYYTKYYLNNIQTSIPYKDFEIKFDKKEELSELKKAVDENDVVIISGQGGCGKSSLMKSYLSEIQSQFSLDKISFSAIICEGDRMNKDSIKEMLECDISFFFETYKYIKRKIFIIDSAEQISYCKNEHAILFNLLKDNGWKIIITCREVKTLSLFEFIKRYQLSIGKINIHNLSEIELNNLANQYDFSLPIDYHLRDYVRIPFNLSLYLANAIEEKNLSFSDYKRKLWHKTICGGSNNSEQRHRYNVVLSLAEFLYLDRNSFSVESNNGAIDALINQQIITCNEKFEEYRFTHDLYGEWAVMELIENCYKTNPSIIETYDIFKVSITGRRCFRYWIGDHLNNEVFDNEIIAILRQEEMKDLINDIVKAILQSNNIEVFLRNKPQLLIDNNMAILKRFLFWLPISNTYISKDDFLITFYKEVPIGMGWNITINQLYNLKPSVRRTLFHDFLSVLLIWCKEHERGESTRKCGEIALMLLQDDEIHYNRELYHKIIPLVFLCSCEIKKEIESIIQNILNKQTGIDLLDFHILEYTLVMKNKGIYRFSKCLPQLMMKIWNYYCYDGHFISNYTNVYSSSGGLTFSYTLFLTQGYFGSLPYSLVADRRFAEEFIPEFLNKFVENSIPDQKYSWDEIVIKIDGDEIKQYGSFDLWIAYRGPIRTHIPYLIEGFLLALLWYLDRMIKAGEIDSQYLINLIKKSNNVMVTAVVTSVAVNHPNEYHDLIIELIMSEELLSLEVERVIAEYKYGGSQNGYTIPLKGLLASLDHFCHKFSLIYYLKKYSSLYLNKDESIEWAKQVLNGQIDSYNEVSKYYEIAGLKCELILEQDKDPITVIDYFYLFPAIIKLCERKDKYADLSCDFILSNLKDDDFSIFLLDYDCGVLYINTIPKLLDLYSQKRKEILDALLSFIIEDSPFLNTVSDMIRHNNLWGKYQSEMIDFIYSFLSSIENRQGELSPKEISIILKLLPINEDIGDLEKLRLNLVNSFFSSDRYEIEDYLQSVQFVGEPISEILIQTPFSTTGQNTLNLLKNYFLQDSLYSVNFLLGLIHTLTITHNIRNFFAVWKELAETIYKFEEIKKIEHKNIIDYHMLRLKRIIMFQDDPLTSDIILMIKNKTEYQVFDKYCYKYLCFLVGNYDVDIDIVRGILLMINNAQNTTIGSWLSLLNKSLKKSFMKSSNEIIHKIGLSILESSMLKCHFLFDNIRDYPLNVKSSIQEILDMMINCGSIKAYYLKEIIE